MSSVSFKDFINLVRQYNPDEIEKVTKAYKFAENYHVGQKRESGEDYVTHPLNVAYILAEMHADADTLCAGLLHDVIEDTIVTKEDLIAYFNEDVANLVDGVTKLSKMNFSTKNEQNIANTRKIITSITSDVRIIIIKLADRAHNMRTLEFKTPFKQRENAEETMKIYVPIAYYIGAYRLKSELEDISFQYLEPNYYQEIAERKAKIEQESNQCLQEMLVRIDSILNDNAISHEIKARTKNIYGIYKKLEHDKESKLSDIHDLLALKVMVEEETYCYQTLGLVHRLYHPVNHKIKDLISNPKTNMYRSLHTTVFGPNCRLVQTQIRTFDMDKIASFGLTAYWDINKGDARINMQKDLSEKYQFYRSLSEIDAMFSDNQEFVNKVAEELFSEKVYVHTMDGEIIELPQGSTPIDVAYHLGVGNIMIGAVVNGEYVAIDQTLKSKDRIQIKTDPLSFGPRDDWYDKAQTTCAKRMIKEFSGK